MCLESKNEPFFFEFHSKFLYFLSSFFVPWTFYISILAYKVSIFCPWSASWIQHIIQTNIMMLISKEYLEISEIVCEYRPIILMFLVFVWLQTFFDIDLFDIHDNNSICFQDNIDIFFGSNFDSFSQYYWYFYTSYIQL